MQVEGAGRWLGVKAPDPLVKRLAVKRLPLGADEGQQKVKLPRGQLHRLAVLGHGAVVGVDDRVEHVQRGRAAAGMAQKPLHPGQQFRRSKRLDDVVICAQFQPTHPVGHGVFGC